MDDHETVAALSRLLSDWQDQHDGNLRVELRLVSKHTGQLVPAPESGAGGPYYPLDLLAFDLDEALKALAFVQYLKKLGRDIMHP